MTWNVQAWKWDASKQNRSVVWISDTTHHDTTVQPGLMEKAFALNVGAMKTSKSDSLPEAVLYDASTGKSTGSMLASDTTVHLPSSTGSYTLSFTAPDNQSVYFDGDTVPTSKNADGTYSKTYAVASGDTVAAKVTLKDTSLGGISTHDYTITRAAGSRPVLTSLLGSDGSSLAKSVLTVGGHSVTSGSPVVLNYNGASDTLIPVTVVADGDTNTYAIRLVRAAGDARLSGLTANNGKVVLGGNDSSFIDTIPAGVKYAVLTPKAADSLYAQISVNGGAFHSSGTVDTVPYTADSAVTVPMVIRNGSAEKTYYVTLVRGPATGVNTSFGLTAIGSKNNVFGKTSDTAIYDTVPYGDTVISFIPAVDSASTLTLNGKSWTSGDTLKVAYTGSKDTVFVYRDTVGSAVDSLTLTPTANSDSATITVNGVKVVSGKSVKVGLHTGITPVVIMTSNSSASTSASVDSIYVYRPKAAGSAITTDFTFKSDSASSTSNSNDTTYTFTPSEVDAGTVLTTGTSTLTNGTAYVVSWAGTSDTTITLKETNALGYTGAYTIKLVRGAAPAAANTDSVAYTTTSFHLVPTAADSDTIFVNGTHVTSGAAAPISFDKSTDTTQTVIIVVKNNESSAAANTTTTLTLKRHFPTTAFAVVANTGTLTKANDSIYTLQLDTSVKTVSLTPTVDDGATLTRNGTAVTSGTAEAIAYTGSNDDTLTYAVSNGSSSKIYKVILIRPLALISLTDANGKVGITNKGNDWTWYDELESSVTELKLTPVLSPSGAKFAVSSNWSDSTDAVVSGGTQTIAVTNSMTQLNIYVYRGSSKLYGKLSLKFKSNSSKLNALGGNKISPVFDSSTFTYYDTVSSASSTASLTPKAVSDSATITVNGTAVTSGTTTNVSVANDASIVVTNGISSTTYTVHFVKVSPYLKSLTSSTATTFTPTFDSVTTSYAVVVPAAATSVEFTGVTSEANAKVSYNWGTAIASGTSTSLSFPTTSSTMSVNVTVTAATGVTKTYTVNVSRATESLSAVITGANGTLVSTGALTYADTIYDADNGEYLTATTSTSGATTTVDGSASNGSAVAVDLSGYPASSVVTVTKDGSTVTYTVTYVYHDSRQLSFLGVSGGTLSPSFDKGTNDYTLTVTSENRTINLTPVAVDPSYEIITVDSVEVTSGVSYLVDCSSKEKIVVTSKNSKTGASYKYNLTVH